MIGETVSHYRIIDKLGEGGMGVVYKAEDTLLRRTVALKFLPSDLTRDPVARARFVHEAQAASALDHPNIGSVHDVDESDDGRAFICMSLYDGETLKQKIERGPMSIEETVGIVRQVAGGLKKAHDAGIIHRDIKPANVIVTNDGLVKIVDFGLAKLSNESRTATGGSRAGTAAYMAPEQIQNGVTDARSDLFSLGMVMYEMLTGTRPFAGEHEASLFYSIVYNEPDPPARLRPEIPVRLNDVVMRLLRKDPAKRFQSAGELIAALDSLGALEGKPKTLVTLKDMFRFVSRHKPATAVSAAVIALVILFAAAGGDPVIKWIYGSGIPAERHVAVLPFTCVDGGKSEEVLADGLMETLTSKLSQFTPTSGSIWVVDSREVRGQNIETPSAAFRTLGATLAVTGSIQHGNGGVRFTINLVEAKTSRLLGSEVFDEPSTNLAGVQDHIVKSLVKLLDVKLQPSAYNRVTAGGTQVSKAYENYLAGLGYMHGYNVESAIEMFRNAVAEDSGYALAYAGLGNAYWLSYEVNSDPRLVDSAVKFSDKALLLDARLAPVHVTLGTIYTGTGHFADAIHEFTEALAIDSSSAPGLIGLAGAYAALGDIRNAESTYRRAIALDSTYYAGYNDLGRFYYLHGRTGDALDQYKKVVQLMPNVCLGYNNLGSIYFYLNRWEDAKQAFEKSISLEPNYVGYSNLGTLLYYQGHYKEAAAAYESALKIDDHNYQVWANLSQAYLQSGEVELAKDASVMSTKRAEENLRLNPNNPRLLVSLAGKYAAAGEKTKARTLISRALSISSDNVVLMGRAAMVYEELGDRQSALMLLEKAFRSGYSTTEIDNSPEMKGLRADPSYKRLLKMRPSGNRHR